MKIRKYYTLYINCMLGTAHYGNHHFDTRISKATIGHVYKCTFDQLKHNLKILSGDGFKILPTKY